MRRVAPALFFSAVLVSPVSSATAADPHLSTAGASYAPLDVSQKSSSSHAALTTAERSELLSEFKGLVHLGLNKVPYERWGGKDMADCERLPPGSGEKWNYRCEIITGQGNGFYYFYPNEARDASTLQALDIRVHASDEKLLDDFRRPVQDLFGQASFVHQPSVQAKPSSRVRRWNTTSDVAELFMDRAIRPEGSVRFVWKRSPLVSSDQASRVVSPSQD